MTTTEIDSETTPLSVPEEYDEEEEKRKRRRLLLVLLWLLLLCCCLGYFALRYFIKPQPLPDMLPAPVAKNLNYPPVYKFSVTGVDEPVGVAASPDGSRFYVAESAGERLIKMFDRDGNLLKSFAPAGTDKANRQPKYIAVDPSGRVFLVDRANNVIDVFDDDGNYLDAILGPETTITKLLAQKFPTGLAEGTSFSYEGINGIVYYQEPGKERQNFKIPEANEPWAPLGLRFDQKGNLLYTDITVSQHSVHIIAAADIGVSLNGFNPFIKHFGSEGKENGQLEFPNSVVTDSHGNFYVSDGNNGRISAWTSDLQYKTFFGFGSTDDTLNLPRGMWMDSKDHLHVADAVGSTIRVYDVSGAEPSFLYSFGGFGDTEGLFNYPVDIHVDSIGRLYIADSQNNRIQIWSY